MTDAPRAPAPAPARHWLRALAGDWLWLWWYIWCDERWLAIAFVTFLASGFLLRPAPVWAMVFYVWVIPRCVWELWQQRSRAWCTPFAALAIALVVWSTLGLLWGEDPDPLRVRRIAAGGLSTLVFVVAGFIVLRKHAQLGRVIGGVMIVGGTLNACLAISIFLITQPPDPRMPGWAETGHPILGAIVVGHCALFAMARWLGAPRHRALYGAATLVLAAFIVLTGSRGPLAAVLVAGLVLCIGQLRRWHVVTLAGLAGAGAVALLLLPGGTIEAVDHLTARGASHRLEIWHNTLARIAERPWFGWGPAAQLHLPEFHFPHSLYLSVLFYSGVVGFGLFVALAGGVLGGLLRRPDVADRRLLVALLVNTLVAGLTDTGQIAFGPAEIWFIFWLPVMLAATALDRSARCWGGTASG